MTPYEQEPNNAGNRLAALAVEHVAHDAELYCNHECERIALENQPRINALNLEGRTLDEHRTNLEERLRSMPPPVDPRERKRRARYYAIVGVVLALAAFAFTIIGFDPYRLGLIGILYCLGVALVTPFVVDEFLKTWNAERVLKAVVTIVFIAAILGGAIMAAIRGELFARKIEQANPPVVIEGATAPAAPAMPSFYDSTATSLQLVMLLFALAMDLGSGIAIHRARAEWGAVEGDYEMVARELEAVRQRLLAIVHEITGLENAAAAFAATFWRDFYSAALTQTLRKAVTKGLAFALIACTLWSRHASAADHTSLVVVLDRSASEIIKGEDGKTLFERNVDAVGRLLATVQADSKVTVIGITADSIADPYPLLGAEVSADVGYFGERLANAREALVRAWRARASSLTATAHGTDILGSLTLASELFQANQKGGHGILVVFSDMRNATKVLDLESPHLRRPDVLADWAERQGLIADLHGVTVYVVGANGGGKDIRGWQTVKEFWMGYFHRAGARCAGYSTLAMPPPLSQDASVVGK